MYLFSKPLSQIDVKGKSVSLDTDIGTYFGIVLFNSQVECYMDTLIANGFTELRIDIPDYQNNEWLAKSKTAVIKAIAEGAKVVWGVSSNSFNNPTHTITSANWPTFRQAILDAAKWAQDSGVYEFQLGNEEEYHVDGTTMTVEQLVINLKSIATEAQTIFTRGKISYSCAHNYISSWISEGKGDIDILASNIYKGGEGIYNNTWKTEITNLFNVFGTDSTYLTEFAPSYTSLADYSSDETVQAEAVTEMLEYIKASGITRALFFTLKDDKFGIIKND